MDIQSYSLWVEFSLKSKLTSIWTCNMHPIYILSFVSGLCALNYPLYHWLTSARNFSGVDIKIRPFKKLTCVRFTNIELLLFGFFNKTIYFLLLKTRDYSCKSVRLIKNVYILHSNVKFSRYVELTYHSGCAEVRYQGFIQNFKSNTHFCEKF